MMALVAASPETNLEGKSNDSSTQLWEIKQTTFQHFTCIHFSSKIPINGLSAEDEAVSLSLFSLICSVRAPVALQHWGLGGSTEGFLLREHC